MSAAALDKLGVAAWTMQATVAAAAGHRQLYAEFVEDVELVEQQGFASVWSAEHHFWHDGWCPALLHAQALAAARTSRIRFGHSMMLLPLHDPVELGRAALTFDRLSGGRLDLGVAIGYRDSEFDAFGKRRDRRGKEMERSLAVLEEVWEGGCGDAAPVQPGGPPVWIGGMAPAAIERAARGGHGLVLPPTLSPSRVEKVLEGYRAALPAELERAPEVGMLRDVHITDDPEAGRRFKRDLRDHYSEEIGSWWVVKGEVGFANPENVAAQVDYNERGAIVGPDAEVAAGIAALFEAGITHLAVRLNFDFLDRDVVRDQVVRLATAVAPLLDAAAANPNTEKK